MLARLLLAHRLLALVCALMCFPGFPAPAQSDAGNRRIVTKPFSVTPPEGGGWSSSLRPDSLGLQITRHKGGIPGIATPEDVTITVFIDSTDEEGTARGADSVAHHAFDQVEAELRALTRRSFGDEVKLQRAERRRDTIGVFPVHVFEAQTRVANFSGTVQEDQQLLLYFPADLDERRQFFVFHMSRVRPNKHGWDKNGFKPLRQVLESFRDERP